jgi:LuxR family maltose regulon positive regulatory protein
MDRPFLATKLYVPAPRRSFVARPRLREKLRTGADSGLTLVSAPAGFGKTALLADWIATTAGNDRSVAWLSLDAGESEPAALWGYVATSLQAAVPGVGRTALELLASPPLATELVLTALVNDLSAVPHDVWLVLDDYHTVDNPETGAGMTYFLEHLPQHVHVVVSTRSDPALPLSRWRVKRGLVEIRAADLRFTPEEAAAYLNDVAGLELAAAQVSTLEQRTEGWIAALQLAALSLRDRADAAGFVERFAGDDRYVVDYLVDEVLEHQPDDVRSFLQHTAILDRLTGPLCDAVTGHGGGSAMLVNLERANLFVIPLDDQREWYRYHHLFADVLRGRLFSEEPGQIPPLHQRASGWYEAHGHEADAVRHALAGQDFDRAAQLVELAVPGLRRNRQDAVLFGWLRALPEAAIRRSPVLSVFFGAMLMASGDLAGVEPWLSTAERGLTEGAAPAGSVPGPGNQEIRTLPATIATYRASLAQARGDAEGTAAYARQALDLARPEDHLARGAAAGFLGLAAWADGDVQGALGTFTQAVASLHAAGNLLDEFSSTVILADMWLAAGWPGEARRLCENALQQANRRGGSMLRAGAELHVALSEISRQSGNGNEARRHLDAAAVFVERGPMTESRYRWFVAKALVAQDEDDRDGAISHLEQAEQLYRPGFFPDVRPVPAVKARMWVRQGKLSEAAGWAREHGITVTGDGGYLKEYSHLTLVRLLIAQQLAGAGATEDAGAAEGAVEDALGLLDRMAAGATQAARAGSVVEIAMLRALLHAVLGNRRQAQEALAAALAAAPEPDGYVRLFLDEGPLMVELLREAAQGATHDGVAAARAQRLLGLAAPPPPAPAGPRDHPPSDVDPLSERELQVLRLLDSELNGPEIARALFISHNTLRTHTKHIFTKLGVTSRRAAVSRARDRGLL